MKNKWRILKILVTVVLLGFLLSFSLKRFSQKPLENISVNLKQTSVYFIDEKDIEEIVKKYNPTGKIGDIDIPALEKKLNLLPAVDSANVYLNLNGNLNLDIKQRIPVFRLNNGGNDFYVDQKGIEFPISKNYSHPCMLVTGNVKKGEYEELAELIDKIDKDNFSKKYFIGISKEKGNYNLLTSEGNYKVELGDLNNIDFKVKGFKTFVEKYLVYQDPEKFQKISIKYDNQIVAALNPNYKKNDSAITAGKKELEKAPSVVKKKALAVANQNSLNASEKPIPIEKKGSPKPVATKKETPKPTVKKMEAKPKKIAEKPKNSEVVKKTSTSNKTANKAKVEIE